MNEVIVNANVAKKYFKVVKDNISDDWVIVPLCNMDVSIVSAIWTMHENLKVGYANIFSTDMEKYKDNFKIQIDEDDVFIFGLDTEEEAFYFKLKYGI